MMKLNKLFGLGLFTGLLLNLLLSFLSINNCWGLFYCIIHWEYVFNQPTGIWLMFFIFSIFLMCSETMEFPKEKPKKRKKQNIKVIENYHLKVDGKRIQEGDFVTFKYGKKELKFGGYFYLADIHNRVVSGNDFMISEKKREDWRWFDDYLNGFIIDKVRDFKVVKKKRGKKHESN